MRTHDAQLANEYDAIAFVRMCRHEQPLRDAGRAKREAEEAKRAVQAASESSESDHFSEEKLASFL